MTKMITLDSLKVTPETTRIAGRDVLPSQVKHVKEDVSRAATVLTRLLAISKCNGVCSVSRVISEVDCEA